MPTKLNYSKRSGLVPPVAFEAHDWMRLNSIFETELKKTELKQSRRKSIEENIARLAAVQKSIEENIARFAAMRMGSQFTKISSQEIKCMLDSFASFSDDKVIDKFRTAHVFVQAEIQTELLAMGLPHSTINMTNIEPAAIIIAAQRARQKLRDSNTVPMKIGYRIELAKYIVALWKSLGRTDVVAWVHHYEAKESPLVQFAAAIIEVIEPESPPSFTVVSRLMREALA